MKGVRVLDLSRLLPGPFATLCLQGLGADVVKVEDPAGGDYLRHVPPLVGAHGAWFAALNRGKRSVALDLRGDPGREALHALLGDADVLVESFRPGVMGRLGLDPRGLRERYPRLVIASLTGWGQTGPWARLPGHDIGYMALAGMFADTVPTVPRMQWADVAAGGLTAALRIVDAVRERDRAGEGCWLDIAMLDGLVGLQQAQFARFAAGAPPDVLLTGGADTYRFYACADGDVAVGAIEPQFAARLGDLATLGARLAAMTREEAATRFGDACVVPVLRLDEVAAHPQVAARALFAGGLPHAPTGPVSGAVPALGEHTEAELARVGYRKRP
jgi:alpha-methylacyl-CoA racemase